MCKTLLLALTLNIYWGGQKVHSGFPIRRYGKTRTNLLASPIKFYLEV